MILSQDKWNSYALALSRLRSVETASTLRVLGQLQVILAAHQLQVPDLDHRRQTLKLVLRLRHPPQVNHRIFIVIRLSWLLVGPPPSRPTSPGGPPIPVHMLPPEQKASSPLPVESVLSTYQQALPGERRASISRSTSPAMAPTHTHSQSLGQNINRGNSIDRPLSREGFAGIGANGRSPSPGPSPGTVPYNDPNANQNAFNAAPAGNLGISLDESGRVTHDEMAEQYRYRQANNPSAQQPPRSGPYGGPPRSPSVQMTSPVGPPPSQSGYTGPSPAPYAQPPYGAPPPPPNGSSVSRPPSVWYGQGQPGYGVPPQQGAPMNHMPSGQPMGYANGAAPMGYHNTGFQDPNQMRRSPSPAPMSAPTGQWIDGKPVLFYGEICIRVSVHHLF